MTGSSAAGPGSGSGPGPSPRWRLALHALDRTGPPMLARAFLRWLAVHHPGIAVEIVAFRGGELLDDFVRLGPVHVLLDPSEPWDHAAPDPQRVRIVRARAAALGPADLTLLVSVAAGQVLDLVPPTGGEVVAWSVEQGADLHWLDPPVRLVDRVDRWLAGSEGTASELAGGHGIAVARVVPEFVEAPRSVDAGVIDHCRAALGVGAGELLVIGAGIGTWRKGIDLFLEVALAALRVWPATAPRPRFVWIGGERDELFGRVGAEVERLHLDAVRVLGSVTDLGPWCAAADVFLHPARLDAFPLVCLTAAATGTPVVGFSGAGGLVEMFGDAFAGAPYPDVAALATAVAELADPAARTAVGASQERAVRDHHLAEAAAPALFGALVATGAPS